MLQAETGLLVMHMSAEAAQETVDALQVRLVLMQCAARRHCRLTKKVRSVPKQEYTAHGKQGIGRKPPHIQICEPHVVSGAHDCDIRILLQD